MTIKQQGGIFGRNPTFNDVDVEGTLTVAGSPISAGGTMAAQDANNVNIDGGSIDGTVIGASSSSTGKFTVLGVGATAPTDLHSNWAQSFYGGKGSVISEIGAFGGIPGIWLTDNAYLDTDTGSFSYLTTNEASAVRLEAGEIGFRSAASGTAGAALSLVENAKFNTSGNLEFTSGKGIDFSATSGTGTSELFDDYEEGVWTPTLGGMSGGTVTYTTQTGRYTKVGRQVTVDFSITVNTNTNTGGNTFLSVPFAAGTAGFVGPLGLNTSSNAAITYVSFFTGNAEAYFYTAGGGTLDGSSVANGSELKGSLTYFV
jgi:hypothetical protein